jgi:hypothetical protein
MLKHGLIAAALLAFSACTFRCDDEGPDKRASVEFKTEKKEIEVPDIDVDMKKKTIEVPTIESHTDHDDEHESHEPQPEG